MIDPGQSRYYGQAAKALGLSGGGFKANPNFDTINSYANAFGASLNDPLYINTAKSLGITSYNSIDDYKQVLDRLGGGGGGGSGGSGDNSSTTRYPNNGSYGNIMGNTNAAGQEGANEAAKWNNMQTDNSGGSPIQVDSLSAADQQAASMKATSDAQIKMLNDLMIKQDEAYKQQLSLQQQQIEASNAALAEQRRQADALSRAYIPTSQATATAPVFNGYNGSGQNPNTLSSLSITGSRSFGTSSLAGLQIA
jgi:hypothetical protein